MLICVRRKGINIGGGGVVDWGWEIKGGMRGVEIEERVYEMGVGRVE